MWLLAFSGFLFLALALMKRVAETQASNGKRLPGLGYKAQDRNLMQQMGLAASFVCCVVLALYVRSEEVSTRHLHPGML